MSKIFKQLNIGEETTSAPAGAAIQLVPDAGLDVRAPATARPQGSRVRVAGVGLLIILVLGSGFGYFSGYFKPRAVSFTGITTPVVGTTTEDQLHAEALDLFRAKDYTKALEKFEDLAKRHPKEAILLNNIGLTYLKLKEFDRAEKYFNQALALAPKDSAIYNNLGSLKMEKLDSDEAVSFFYQAIAYHPEMIEAHLNLAKAYELAGRPVEAVPEYQYFLEHGGAQVDKTIRGLIEKRVSKINSFSRTTKSSP